MSRARAFRDEDYPAYAAVLNRSYGDYGWTVEEMRHYDSTFEGTRYFNRRLVSEDDGRVVGVVDIRHSKGTFHPDKYRFEVVVDPDFRRRGHGSALYDAGVDLLRKRGAILLRGGTKESLTDGVEFALRRGWVEAQRAWESRLDVRSFEFGRFARADERVAAEGVVVTTLAAERARDPEALQKAYELHEACRRDVPSPDPVTEVPFDQFRRQIVESPSALPDAYFIAVHDGRYVGESFLERTLADEEVLYQGLTGVLPEYRGKGVAMALKLRTARYALEQGKREIRTWNDTRNRPMLRINEAMGFVKQPVWIDLEKALEGGG